MYQYSFKDSQTDQIIQNANKSNSLQNKFSEVDKKYTTLDNQTTPLGLTQKEFTKPTDEEILKTAENSLFDYKNKNLNSINQEYSDKQNSIDKQIQNATSDAIAQEQKIKSIYSTAKQNASNDALKRGLARSSIIVNKLNNFDNQMINNLNELNKTASENISKLSSQKDILESQKNSALNSFDIAYAIKLQEKIDNLNSEISKKQQDVIDYNNKIKQAEAEWQKKQQDDIYSKNKQLLNFIAEHGYGAIEEIKSSEKYNIAKQTLTEMPAEEAISELENNAFYKANLGSYYSKLLSEQKARLN